MVEIEYTKFNDCWGTIPTVIFNDLSYVYDRDGKAIGDRYALERKNQVKLDIVTIYPVFWFMTQKKERASLRARKIPFLKNVVLS